MAFEGSPGYAGGPLGQPTGWPRPTYGGVGSAVGGSAGRYSTAYGAGPAVEDPAATVPQPVLAPYQQTPEVEARAAAEFMQVASADLIRKLYHYLEAHSQRFRQLVECIPMVRRSAELYGAGDYTAAFSQAYQAYRGITILRAGIPELPSL
ncbi:MAG TPA: hypothetical protein VJQ46_02900 [Gemmatimonadales bacterium]|nr:hypothetical protein [Gemmatimonadales bacterium]